jgi:1,4-alpha-glucan branching enzyme
MGIQEAAVALARCGLVALLSAPGVPMIYAGQEYGEDSPRTIDFAPLQWSRLGRKEYAEHYRVVQRLIRARRTHAALRSDWIEFLPTDFAHEKVVRFRRWDAEGRGAVVAINFGHDSRSVGLPFPHLGNWRDVVSNRSRKVEQEYVTLRLAPYSAVLFVPSVGR